MKMKSVLALSSVLCNTVQDRVEDDQHTDGHKLLAEVKDVIADQAVIRVHIGFLGEGVQRAIGKQLNARAISCASGSDCLRSSARKSCKVGTSPV